MKKAIVTCVLLVSWAMAVLAQPGDNPVENLADGNFFFSEEDYQEAIFYFLKLEGTPYMNANIQYKTGVCYLNIPGKEHLSIPYLEKAGKNISGAYKARSDEEERAPLHTLFYLGRAYRISNQLDKALETFTAFKKVPGFEKNYNLNLVNNEIAACEKAKIIGDIPLNVEIMNMGSPVNTEADNYNAVISPDGRVLVFVTDLKFYDAVFMSVKEPGGWTEPVNITPQIESDGDAYPTSLSADGKTLYLVRGSRNNRDIYVSHFKDNSWTRMEPLNENINTNRAESHASLSPDGKTLYFTSNRRGGQGEMDIYLSKMDENGNWGPAQNLGPVINTPYNEESPFIAENGNTLFFSSEGHYNMGGFDIFYSHNRDGVWTDPVNIGFPINTTGDNIFFQPAGPGKSGYLADIRPEGLGGKDIYSITILDSEESGEVVYSGTLPAEEYLPKGFVIRLNDSTSGKRLFLIRYDPDKKSFFYETILPHSDVKVEKL